jgi:hypothetical protein
LTAPPDGQTLEVLIGDLQSEWGVPQYPQEYRITLKVAEEREARSARLAAAETSDPDTDEAQPADPEGDSSGPRREKAPAMRAGAGEGPPRAGRRRGRRRKRRGRGGGAEPQSGDGTPPSS